MALCKNTAYVPPYSFGTSSLGLEKYSTLKSYGNSPFPEKQVITNEIQPQRLAKRTYCKTNNMCADTETYKYLNKRGVEPSPFFKQTPQGDYKSTVPDDRLYDTSRNYNMTLDIPPIQVYYDLKHDNMDGSKKLRNYGRRYVDYASVNAGQIQYYIDKDISQPFFSPVYGMPSKTTGYMWRDPMGTLKPQFEKDFDNTRLQHVNMLSSIEDTTKHRDDIIARQQRTHNERRYDLIYGR